MRKLLNLQFVRYVLVGIGNTAFSYGVFAALMWGGLEYRIANLLALLLGIAISFMTQGTIVFQNANRFTLLKFILAWALLYGFNISIIALLIRTPMSTYLAGAIATVPVTLVSYIVLRFAVFGSKSPNQTIKPTT